MKVLRVISSMNPENGGPGQGIRNSIPELVKLEIINEVACLDNPDELFLKKDNFKSYALGPGKTSWCYSSKLLPWLLTNLPEFDVVIVHGIWQYHGYAVLKAIQQLKKNKNGTRIPRYYVMPHGMLDPYFQLAASRKLKAIRNRIYWKLLEKKVINNADGILFTCKAELMLARQTFKGYKPKAELNIGYGIQEPPVFTEKMKGSFDLLFPEVKNEGYLLFLSRIHPKKGVDLLIDAYEQLFIQNMDKEFKIPKLVIAGPGLETNFGQSLMRKLESNNILNNRIKFTGMLSGDSKWGAFYGCQAFILPSHQENFGISVVEAMACGKPVLISNQVNIFHEIQESNAGLIDEDTLNGTFNLLSSWIKLNETDKVKMGMNAMNVFKDKFSISKVVGRFEEVINS